MFAKHARLVRITRNFQHETIYEPRRVFLRDLQEQCAIGAGLKIFQFVINSILQISTDMANLLFYIKKWSRNVDGV